MVRDIVKLYGQPYAVYKRKDYLLLKPITIPSDERSPLSSYSDDELMEELMARSRKPLPKISEEVEKILKDLD